MLRDITINILTWVICSIIGLQIKRGYKNFKNRTVAEPPEKGEFKKVSLKKQFYYSYICFPVALITGWLLPSDNFKFTMIKVFLFEISFFAFIIAWGAFEAAISRLPEYSGDNKPSGNQPKDTANK